jgi:hypothetical protein
MMNPHWEPIDFYMPKRHGENSWVLVLDTRVHHEPDPIKISAGKPYRLIPRSMAVFCEVEEAEA